MNQKKYILPKQRIWKSPPARGAALLLLLLILILGMSSLLLSQLNERTAFVLEEQNQTTKALIQAKEILLGYAANYYENHLGEYGFLPCPDRDAINTTGSLSEGVEHAMQCGNKNENVLGRLPWKSLGIPPLRDGTGECLWYAISGPYKNTGAAKTDMLNEDTNGFFEVSTDPNYVSGSDPPADRAVAVVVAPGRILANQDRSTEMGAELCGGNYDYHNYLELGIDFSKTKLNLFISSLGNVFDSAINDRVISITREELWQVIRKRADFESNMRCLVEIASTCVGNFHLETPAISNESIPYPAPIDLIDYSKDSSYSDKVVPSPSTTSAVLGRLPDDISNTYSKVGGTAMVDQHLLMNGCDLSTTLDSSQFTTSCAGTDLQAVSKCNLAEFLKCKTQPSTDPCHDKELVIGCNDNSSVEAFQGLWKNWKDHLFYALSKGHFPTNGSTSVSCRGAGSNPSNKLCADINSCKANCVNTPNKDLDDPNKDINDRRKESCPAVVLFAGKATGLQDRGIKEMAWNYLNNSQWGNNNFTLVKQDIALLKIPDVGGSMNNDTNDIISSCVIW